MNRLIFIIPFLFYACGQKSADKQVIGSEQTRTELEWHPFENDVFELAKTRNKWVYLHVGAQWCHWCHVMEEKTYSDPDVQKYLQEHFILAREDQDSRPDLFTRYRAFGWPALIVFDSEKNELLKLKGYQPATKLLQTLREIDPNRPLNSDPVDKNKFNNTDQSLTQTFLESLDTLRGGLSGSNKFLSYPAVNAAIEIYADVPEAQNWLVKSVSGSLRINDPVWGGVFQYSTRNDWNHPHFEKLLRVQAEHIQLYLLCAGLLNRPELIEQAESILNYCDTKLTAGNGLYYTSQDADYQAGKESAEFYKLNNEQRNQQKQPPIHQEVFLKENAMLGKSLIYLWASAGKAEYRSKAGTILAQCIQLFQSENGLFFRQSSNENQFSLDDNLALLDLLITAQNVSGDSRIAPLAISLSDAIWLQFVNKNGTLNSVSGNTVLEPSVLLSSNFQAALLFQKLGVLFNHPEALAKSRQLTATIRTEFNLNLPGSSAYGILTEKWLNQDPVHATLILHSSADENYDSLISEILLSGPEHLIIQRVYQDHLNDEEALLYGTVPAGTVFICNSSYCSNPMRTASELREFFRMNP